MSYKTGAQRWAAKSKGQNREPGSDTQAGRAALRYRALRGDTSAQVALDEHDAQTSGGDNGGDGDED